jgi:hypothetical protein
MNGTLAVEHRQWQVTSRTANAEIRAGIIEQQARYELAKKWATMPGATEPLSDVASACSSKLAT